MELLTTWDLRYAVRNLRKSRGLATIAVITLAIGIGANSAIFSIVDSVLLRPLPYRNPGQLVRLYETEAAPGRYPFAGPDFIDWKTQNKTFQDMTLFGWPGDMNLSDEGRPDHVIGLPTEANFFSVFGVNALLGRTWQPGEDQPGKDQVAILSYGLWRQRYAGEPSVIGRTIDLNSKKYTIVGVMPASFRFPTRAQLWIPLDMDGKTLGERGSHWANAVGRLKPGVTLETALADLRVIAARLEKAYPNSNDKIGAAAVSLHDDLIGDSRNSLLLMLTAVGLVLLIACANVANLLLSRALSRQKEMAVRSALGASRGRLFRQLLTESLLLSLAGGVAGLLLAWVMIGLAAASTTLALPRFNVIQLNAEVLGFTFALAVTTGILFGMVPALRTSRPDVHDELKGGAGSSISPGKQRRITSNAFVVGEIALSLLLLVGAGLLLKDFARVRSLDVGVRAEGVLTTSVHLPQARYKTQQEKFAFSQAFLEESRRITGVDAAAVTSHLPLEGGSNFYAKLRGQTTRMSDKLVETHGVSPGYFQAMGVRLVQGRDFSPADIQKTLTLDRVWEQAEDIGARVSHEQMNGMIYPSVINETMARYFWPHRSPLGQMFSHGSDNGPWQQVIGVVSDVRQWGLTIKPVPEAYGPFDGSSRMFLVLHSSLPPAALTPQVRRALARVDPSLPLFAVRTMDQVIANQAQGKQFLSLLVGSFAAIAMLLAAIGIYGVLSYVVTQRTREIGIRMSLGASRARVLGDVIWGGMRLAVLGFLGGILGSFAAGRVLASLLHEVHPSDPGILAASAGLLGIVALVACYLPARRAASLEPVTALRYE